MAVASSPSESLQPFNHLDDVSFNAVIYELSHGPLNFDLDRLESLVFNPFEHLTSAMDCPLMTNLDPDLNFFASSPPTSRYTWLKMKLTT